MTVSQPGAAAEGVRFVGIDVGKFTAVVAVHGQKEVRSFAMDGQGHAQLLRHLAGLAAPLRLGLEATGGYEAGLWERLAASGLDVRQVAPSKVHAYARSVGRRAKTDACDAATIAAYLAANPEAGRRLPDANVRRISALSAKRRHLTRMRKALACQAQQARCDLVAEQDRAMMALIDAQVAQLEAEIQRVIEAEEALAARYRLLRSIPGIGAVSAFTLLGDMPELGRMTPGAAAALAGLAPFARDSGTVSGPRFIQGGRHTIRHVLYMAAVRASSLKTGHKAFADRLRAKNKPGKQIIIAIARKLIEAANAVLKRKSPWIIRQST